MTVVLDSGLVVSYELDAESDLTEAECKEYAERLTQHITYVREAGRRIGVSPTLLDVHDLSKWSRAEFAAYAKYFCGKSDVAPADNPIVSGAFARAWLHHIHYNPHHWQHWIFPDNFSPKGSDVERGVVEMPQRYALEMIADWMGASRVYTGSWDITDWLQKNMQKIRVHSRTARYLRDEFVGLTDIAHPDIVNGCRFGSELE